MAAWEASFQKEKKAVLVTFTNTSPVALERVGAEVLEGGKLASGPVPSKIEPRSTLKLGIVLKSTKELNFQQNWSLAGEAVTLSIQLSKAAPLANASITSVTYAIETLTDFSAFNYQKKPATVAFNLKEMKGEFKVWSDKARAGDNAAKTELAWLHCHGRGVPQNSNEAMRLFKEAAAAGHVLAMYYRAILLISGASNEGYNYPEGQRLIEMTLAAGHPVAQLFMDRPRVNPSKAIYDWHVDKANRGDGLAFLFMGALSYFGHMVPTDHQKAFQYFVKCANAGGVATAWGELNLGLRYELGHGVKQDSALAAKYYSAAAEHGSISAPWFLANLCEVGKGVVQNIDSAVKLWKSSADKDVPIALMTMGTLQELGKNGFPKNLSAAFALYSRAAAMHHKSAVIKVAEWCEKGIGTPQNLSEALKYYQLASEFGYGPEFATKAKEVEQQLLRSMPATPSTEMPQTIQASYSAPTQPPPSQSEPKPNVTSSPMPASASASSSEQKVKFVVGEDIFKRSLNKASKISEVIALISNSASLAEGSYKVTYTDKAGDKVRIANESDWQEALGEGQDLLTLTVTMTVGAGATPPSFSSQVPRTPSNSVSGSFGGFETALKSGVNGRYVAVLNNNSEPIALGVGSFGAVFLCTDTSQGIQVALKVNKRSSDAEANAALEEALKLKELKHPHIVACFSAFVITQPFLQVCTVLEYCNEGDLNAYLKKMHSGAVPNDFAARLKMMRQLSSALEYLHNTMRVLHRDIKAANVLVVTGPIVKLSDFGMAKELSSSSHAHSMVGTPYYMSPEVKDFLPYGRASEPEAAFSRLPQPQIPAALVTSNQANSDAFFAAVKNVCASANATQVLPWIVQMLQRNAEDRPSIESIMAELGS